MNLSPPLLRLEEGDFSAKNVKKAVPNNGTAFLKRSFYNNRLTELFTSLYTFFIISDAHAR
jgi:hypothetical protein